MSINRGFYTLLGVAIYVLIVLIMSKYSGVPFRKHYADGKSTATGTAKTIAVVQVCFGVFVHGGRCALGFPVQTVVTLAT